MPIHIINILNSKMSNTKILAFASVVVLGTIAALMIATSSTVAPVAFNQITVKRDMFGQWKNLHGKSYGTPAEEETRFNIWSVNYDWVQEHNTIQENTYTVGMTHFADLTNQEFQSTHTSCTFNNTVAGTQPFDVSTVAAATVDWRSKGAVTPVKNQGSCGSCWAFSTVGSLEGLHAITEGSLLSFSEQQLVDCSTSYGNAGCNGGLMDFGFQYSAVSGIELESVYPYTAKDGTCQYNVDSAVFQNTGFTDVPAKDNDALAAAVTQQTVSVAIDAGSLPFQFYTSGVFNSYFCGTSLDHGVLAVGYGTDSNKDYWIVKNSWGSTWGEQGYIRIAKQSGSGAGMCGIALSASFPTGTTSVQQKNNKKSSNEETNGEW